MVLYKGVQYRLAEKAHKKTVRTGSSFPIIRKEYKSETRELRYAGGTFILDTTLRWNFSPEVATHVPVSNLKKIDAALMFAALHRDGGTVSNEYKEQKAAGTLPSALASIEDPSRCAYEQKHFHARTEGVTADLSWEKAKILRSHPDKEVAKVTFTLCAPDKFSLEGYPHPNATRDKVDAFSQKLHLALTKMFPGAMIDTQVVEEADSHCGFPIVLNRNGAPINGHDRIISDMAARIWREYL